MSKANIIQGRTRIEIPTSNGILAVAHPFYGPADSLDLRRQIENDGLVEPTSRDVAFFAESLYGRESPIEQEATKLMKERYFRAFTGILYNPRTELVHFINNPVFDENSVVDGDNLL